MQEVRRKNLILLTVAVAAGALFFSHLGELWPLARVDLLADRGELVAEARRDLAERGLDATGYRAASRLVVDDAALDYLERAFGFERAQELIVDGLPVYLYEVHFKRQGEPDRAWVTLHPEHGLIEWGRTVQEDAPGATLGKDEARALALAAVAALDDPGAGEGGASGPAPPWEERGAAEQLLPARVDHQLAFERVLSESPELRERLVVTVSGDRVSAVDRGLVVPGEARRAARRRQAPLIALQTFGFLALGVLSVVAFTVFLTRLRAGTARLGPPVVWASLVGGCFLVTEALQGASLLLGWDPLWPWWVSVARLLGIAAAGGGFITLILLVVISAGDALDREVTGGRRGESLWLAGRGRLAAPEVGLASLRGFLIGVICGGVMTVAFLALEAFAVGPGSVAAPIQPRGFFFHGLNSEVPALSTLLYFLMVALGEELGYRFFAGTWLLGRVRSRTGSRWLAALVAVVVPALVYGTTHTGLTFLPPEDPFWGRALVFTLVGCVWGWAFLRFDALTVVLSHWTADLFIFNWPRLGSGEPALVAAAVATIAVPLVPAALWALRPTRR